MLDAEPKRFIFFHQSERLLRKKPSRAQRKANAAIEADFKRAATKDAALFNFECLHGPVSVFLHIHEPVTGDSPLIPPVAKAYIDALQGIAYKDDRQVEHLLVRHDSHRHPMLKGGPTEDDSAQGDGAGVFIDVEPVGTTPLDTTMPSIGAFGDGAHRPFERRGAQRRKKNCGKCAGAGSQAPI
jgi:hypothetical protein